jgi:hypothetical protein
MRSTRSDSISTAIDAMKAAGEPLPQWPSHLRKRDVDAPYWDAIVRSRARSEWAAVDLVIAAQLARCQADIETQSMMLDAEGATLENARGTIVANARTTVVEQLARRQLALMRCLNLASVVSGDKSTIATKRKTERDATATREALEDEDLLAT